MILLGYTVPTVYLAMYCDFNRISLSLLLAIYTVFALSHAMLCFRAIRWKIPFFVILGNLLGMVTNYLCWLLIPHPEKWRYYFKCSPSSKFLLAILGISFTIQLAVLLIHYAKWHWIKA